MKIIAFTGRMGSGKSTAADYLVEKHGFVKVNFKDALVKEMKERFGGTLKAIYEATGETWIGDNEMYDWLFKVKPPIMRALMQNYGTEVRRGDHPLYWVKKWKKEAEAHKNVVVDDCRFLNEAEAVLGMSGRIIRLDMDGSSQSNHISETEMDSIPASINIKTEKGGQEKLYEELEKILHETIY